MTPGATYVVRYTTPNYRVVSVAFCSTPAEAEVALYLDRGRRKEHRRNYEILSLPTPDVDEARRILRRRRLTEGQSRWRARKEAGLV